MAKIKLSLGEKIYAERLVKELGNQNKIDESYYDIYNNYSREITILFSFYPNLIKKIFKYMIKSRCCNANNSREAIELFNKIKEILDSFSNKKIKLNEKYLEIIN